jgi:hypothetical protein
MPIASSPSVTIVTRASELAEARKICGIHV